MLTEENEEKDTLEEKMLINNDINCIINMELRYEDNKKCFYYNTKGMISVEEYLKIKKADYGFLYNVYDGIAGALLQGEAYFIHEENYVIKPDYIYLDKRNNKIAVCCVPWRESDFQKDIIELTSFFLKKTDHNDKMAVEFIYGMYNILACDGFLYDNVKLYMNNFQCIPEDKSDSDTDYNKNEESICKDTKYDKGVKATDDIVYGLALCGGYKSDKRFGGKTAPENILITMHNGITMEKDKEEGYIIGRSNESDIYIPLMQISRRHAMIYPESDGINIKDLGSTNGTYINDKKISAHVTIHCKLNDIVTFANIKYRVIKKEAFK